MIFPHRSRTLARDLHSVHNLPTVVRKSCIGAGFCRPAFQTLTPFNESGADVWMRIGITQRNAKTLMNLLGGNAIPP